MEIEIRGRTLELELTRLTSGTRLWVMEYTQEQEWQTVSNYLYPLQTDFEILCSFASEFFGESIEGETLAELMGVPFISYEEQEQL